MPVFVREKVHGLVGAGFPSRGQLIALPHAPQTSQDGGGRDVMPTSLAKPAINTARAGFFSFC